MGNGKKIGRIVYREFSLDIPFGGRPPCYDIESNSAIFYGGATGFFPTDRGGLEEYGINTGEGKMYAVGGWSGRVSSVKGADHRSAAKIFDVEKLWTYETGGQIWMDFWVAEGVLYVACEDGYLYALE